MAFERYIPRLEEHAIKPGMASIDAKGTVRLHAEDAKSIGLNGKVALLIDATKGLLAVRSPIDEDSPVVFTRRKNNGRSGHFHAAGALRKMGVDYTKKNGKYEIMKKDNLLILIIGN